MASITLPLRSPTTEQVGQKRRRTEADNNTDQPNHTQLRRSRRRLNNLSCEVCTRMLSQEGLEHLNSTDGFWHLNRTDCATSANAGCGICKLILFIVCKEHDNDWPEAPAQRLIFRNLGVSRSSSMASNSDPIGIYGIGGTLESEPTKFTVTIQLFAKQSEYSLAKL